MVKTRGRAKRRERERLKKEEFRPLLAGPVWDTWKRRLHLIAALSITTFFLLQLYGFNIFYNQFKWDNGGRPKALDKFPEFASAPHTVQLMYMPDSFIYYQSMLSMRGDREFEHRYRYLRAGYTILGVAVSRIIPIRPTEVLPFVNLVLMGAVLFLTYLISGSLLAPAFCFAWGNLWAEWGFVVLPDTAGALFLLLALWFRFRHRFVLSLATFAVGLLMREIIVFGLPLLLTDRRLDRRALAIAAVGIAAFLILQMSQVQEIAGRMTGTIGDRLAAPGKTLGELQVLFQVSFGPFSFGSWSLGTIAYKLAFIIMGYVLVEGFILPAEMVDAEHRLRDLHLLAVLPLNLLVLFLFAEDFTGRYIIFFIPALVVLSVSMLWSVWGLAQAAFRQEAAATSGTNRPKGAKG